MTKRVLRKTTSAIFLAIVLVAGTITLMYPSFIVGAQATSDREKDYDNDDKSRYYNERDYDSYDKKSYRDDDYGKDKYDKRYDSYGSTKYSDHKKDMKYNDYDSEYGKDNYKKSYDKKDSYGTPNYKDNQDKRYNPY